MANQLAQTLPAKIEYDLFTNTPIFDLSVLADSGLIQIFVAVAAAIASAYIAYSLLRPAGTTDFKVFSSLASGSVMAGILSYVIFLSLQAFSIMSGSSSFTGILILVHVALLFSLFVGAAQIIRIKAWWAACIAVACFAIGFFGCLDRLAWLSVSVTSQMNTWNAGMMLAALMLVPGLILGCAASLLKKGNKTILRDEPVDYESNMDVIEKFEARSAAKAMFWLRSFSISVVCLLALEVVLFYAGALLVNSGFTRTFPVAGTEDAQGRPTTEYALNLMLLAKEEYRYDESHELKYRLENDYGEGRERIEVRGYRTKADASRYYIASANFGSTFDDLRSVIRDTSGLEYAAKLSDGKVVVSCAHNPVNQEGGWATAIYADVNGRNDVLIEQRFFDAEGVPKGLSRYAHDDTGAMVEELDVTSDGVLTGRWTYSYSENGWASRRWYYVGHNTDPTYEDIRLPGEIWYRYDYATGKTWQLGRW